MQIWHKKPKIESVNNFLKDTMVENLGIEITEIGTDYISGSMPVDSRTVQPMRLLHGGASVCLAETLGSIASNLVCDPDIYKGAVGIAINANHLKAVKEGNKVFGVCKPMSLGRNIHVWEIKIFDEDQLICVSRLTTKLLKK